MTNIKLFIAMLMMATLKAPEREKTNPLNVSDPLISELESYDPSLDPHGTQFIEITKLYVGSVNVLKKTCALDLPTTQPERLQAAVSFKPTQIDDFFRLTNALDRVIGNRTVHVRASSASRSSSNPAS